MRTGDYFPAAAELARPAAFPFPDALEYNIRMDSPALPELGKIRVADPGSHKGQNGRLLVIGGSQLFHAASLWSLTVASRIVDLVHYCSTDENNRIVEDLKSQFTNGIVVPRFDVDIYIKEDDVILIGPGMTRDEETKSLTDRLLGAYPDKQWVIDAGALQMMELTRMPKGAIITPHHQEFRMIMERSGETLRETGDPQDSAQSAVRFASRFSCNLLLKGIVDIATNGTDTRFIRGGNAGMTKGGTGDVLAGLIAALSCVNDPWDAMVAGSVINKAAGDDLFASVGPFFNATDLSNQIPKTMKRLLLG